MMKLAGCLAAVGVLSAAVTPMFFAVALLA